MRKPKQKADSDVDQVYEVGYGKPPAETQFKKGQSGNPKGRPKGSTNLVTTLRRALNEKVVISENGRQKAVSKGEAAIKQLVNRAVKGEIAYMRLLLPAMNAADAALATEAGKATHDLTDPSILAPLIEQLGRGTHVVLASPPSESSPADPNASSDTCTPGDDSNSQS